MDEAERLAQEAICEFLDPEYTGDPEQETDLLWKLQSIVNGLISNLKRKHSTIFERSLEPAGLDSACSGSSCPETEALTRVEAGRVTRLLLSHVGGDELVREILRLQLDEGIEKPRDQAERLDRPIAEVYNARRRLGGHLDAMRERLCEEEKDV